jgi:YesN/AraC family two-component response regulator
LFGSYDLDVRQIAMELGVADFLTKPVDLDQLCGTLSGLMPITR